MGFLKIEIYDWLLYFSKYLPKLFKHNKYTIKVILFKGHLQHNWNSERKLSQEDKMYGNSCHLTYVT